MKKIVLILLLSLSFHNCSAQKTSSEILYFLPSRVKEKIITKIKEIEHPNKISFTLGNDNSGNYIIYLNTKPTSDYQFWIDNSNRKLFLNGVLYPLVLESDEIFSYPESAKSVLYKIENEQPIKSIRVIRDNVFNVKFKSNGEIIE